MLVDAGVRAWVGIRLRNSAEGGWRACCTSDEASSDSELLGHIMMSSGCTRMSVRMRYEVDAEEMVLLPLWYCKMRQGARVRRLL
jgi:hypothetical protein